LTRTEIEDATEHFRERGEISETGVDCDRGYRLIRRAQINGDMPKPRPEQVLIRRNAHGITKGPHEMIGTHARDAREFSD
jgi:hypothetical protein